MSKVDTPTTAAAMAPRTRPPATTERRVFLREGVTAASATRGLASAAAVPTVTAAESFSTLELFGAGAGGGGEGGSEKYSARGKRPANWHGCVEDRGAVIDERFLADRSRGGASTDGGRDIDPRDLPRAFRDVSGDAPERSRPRFARLVNRPSPTNLSANSTDHQSGGGPLRGVGAILTWRQPSQTQPSPPGHA